MASMHDNTLFYAQMWLWSCTYWVPCRLVTLNLQHSIFKTKSVHC